jgi:NAD(P)-dependent dehydrogenase (short-subunit alcohol dehydrogenase family)
MSQSAHCTSTSLALLSDLWLTRCVQSNRSDKPDEIDAVCLQLFQTNVVGNIHLFHQFLPLVLKGKAKKVITITTGVADLDLTNDLEIDVGALYAASKAATNMIVAKFNVQYKKDGVLFMGISPGLVEVGRYNDGTFPSCLQSSGVY